MHRADPLTSDGFGVSNSATERRQKEGGNTGAHHKEEEKSCFHLLETTMTLNIFSLSDSTFQIQRVSSSHSTFLLVTFNVSAHHIQRISISDSNRCEVQDEGLHTSRSRRKVLQALPGNHHPVDLQSIRRCRFRSVTKAHWCMLKRYAHPPIPVTDAHLHAHRTAAEN